MGTRSKNSGVRGAFGRTWQVKKISQFPTYNEMRRVVRSMSDEAIPSFMKGKKVGWILNNHKDPQVREFILQHFPNAYI